MMTVKCPNCGCEFASEHRHPWVVERFPPTEPDTGIREKGSASIDPRELECIANEAGTAIYELIGVIQELLKDFGPTVNKALQRTIGLARERLAALDAMVGSVVDGRSVSYGVSSPANGVSGEADSSLAVAESVEAKTHPRVERCVKCNAWTSDWVDPDGAGGRICRYCDSLL
jgi:hypothetical protein